MELIVKPLSDEDEYGWGLVSKRLMRVVESCATSLTQFDYDGPESFPCWSRNLRSLEGCPDGLKSLDINGRLLESLEPLRGCTELESLEIMHAYQISDHSPLNACTKFKKLYLPYSKVTAILALASMPLLEEMFLLKTDNQPSIKDLSPLSQYKRLKTLDITGNCDIEDISPFAQCTQLEELEMLDVSKITDLKLKYLGISHVPVEDLTPLSALQDLEWLSCGGIPLTTSLLPLAQCSKLRNIGCNEDATYLVLLKERRPDIYDH